MHDVLITASIPQLSHTAGLTVFCEKCQLGEFIHVSCIIVQAGFGGPPINVKHGA
jgi:hypothetical protein